MTTPSASDTAELKGQHYYFVGARYRITVIPQFLVNLFVNEGGTFISHTVGAELDMRSDDHSTIPWLAFTTFGFGDTLFQQKGSDPTNPGNWTVVNSSLSALFLGLDELWSIPLDLGHHVDFEYGFGVGVGVVFGSLENNWVHPDPNGPLQASAGIQTPPGGNGRFAPCVTTRDGPGCSPYPPDHQNAAVAKVNGYTEPNWFNGGSVPVVFPHISFPQLGLRIKPVKQFELRVGLGFSLTGFWAGLSGAYGLEKTESGKKE
jgi:hypothetical protein